MKNKPGPENDLLRLCVEKYLENKFTGNDMQQSEGDTLKLLHELAVHQVELEINDATGAVCLVPRLADAKAVRRAAGA